MTGEHTSVIYGTHYPNRLFVGCLPPEAGAEDLGQFFKGYGKVVEAKVVLDDMGRSKRFGFVTFSSKEKVDELIKCRCIKFQGKMINVGPAVKKNLESESANSRPPKTSPSSSTTTKTSIYKGPQHVPKTVVLPTNETQELPEAPVANQQQQQEEPVQRKQSRTHQKDDWFCNTWGISSRKSSVWSAEQSNRQSHNTSLTSNQDVFETPYSSLLSLEPHHDHCISNYPFQLGNAFGRLGLGAIAPPPGFYQTWYEK